MFMFFFFIYDEDLIVFFFFQAEDGIRDGTVTGVQTCALPISRRRGRSAALTPGPVSCPRGAVPPRRLPCAAAGSDARGRGRQSFRSYGGYLRRPARRGRRRGPSPEVPGCGSAAR